MPSNCPFTIRVYAVLTNMKDEVLLTKETYRGVFFCKFPGGGLEYGEGTLDTLKRELHEELHLSNVDFSHFYTTDTFVESFFDTNTQVLSIYYKNRNPLKDSDVLLAIGDKNLRGLKWIPIDALQESDVTFPIDKKVVALLKSAYG